MPKTDTALAVQAVDQGLVTVDNALERAGELFDLIPDIEDDPTPRMMAAILNADDPSDINRIFESRAIKAAAGRTARFDALRKAPSDFADTGPAFYLVADVTWKDTGEQDVLTISSQMSMLELLVAQQKGWLPLTAEVVQKERKTKRGFHPIHLRILEHTVADSES